MDNERLLILQGFRRLDGAGEKNKDRGVGIVKSIVFGKKGDLARNGSDPLCLRGGP